MFILVERLTAFIWHNLSNYDKSVKIGMSSLHGSLDKKIVRANWNFNMAAIFQDGWHLVQQLSNIIVYLVIQAWKLAWAVSVGHLTRILSEAIEISIWRPYFEMADNLVQQLQFIWWYKHENWHEQSLWVTWQDNCQSQLKFQYGG